MTPEQHREYIEAMKAEIRITVNGKVDKIKENLDNYIKTDNEWKERAQPALDAFSSMSTTWKALLWLFGGIGIMAAAILSVVRLIKGA